MGGRRGKMGIGGSRYKKNRGLRKGILVGEVEEEKNRMMRKRTARR